jgi:Probable cobalt transporter subunit (CbtB)
VSTDSARQAVPTPLILPAQKVWLMLGLTVLLALGVLYFIGVDQGAVSMFGHDMHIHEFTHDARHFLGFPCH